jgi:sugar phosphate isomerase/epimerase
VKVGPLGIPPGCQIWPYRRQLVADFDRTLRQVRDAGFELLEFCSPPGYAPYGLEPLTAITAPELRRRIENAGLTVVSCHYQFGELTEHADERIDFARELGLAHMVVASVGRHDTLDSWLRAADELNRVGEKTRAAGIQLGFHNHSQEFEEMNGVLVFDAMMDRFDPALVKYQYHLQNPARGLRPADVLRKYPGRYLSVHIMDYASGAAGTVPVGRGDLDWTEIFHAARTGGITYYFVEMGLDSLESSGPFLRSLSV